jgi:hypothetical protein
MIITGFQNLLQAARMQPEPQQMLFVFARKELPEDASPEEKQRFENGQGGVMTPIMYVDKKPTELETFADLVKESRQMGQDWDFVFVGCLSGQGDREPSDAEVTKALEVMVKSVQGGIIDHLLVYRPDGEQVRLRGPQI